MARTCLVYEIYPTENPMTLICPFNFIKGQMLQQGKLKGHIYMTYYIYFIQTLIIWCTIYEKQHLERSVTLIWPLNVIQGQRSQGQLKDHIYDFVYVFHTNIGHSMPRFWDIGLNR